MNGAMPSRAKSQVMRTKMRAALFVTVMCVLCGGAQGQSLPSGWSDGDIGSVGVAGSATFSNATFTVSGAGTDVRFATTDGFHFAYQAITGNGSVVARVTGEPANWSAQAGIMFRESLANNARN